MNQNYYPIDFQVQYEETNQKIIEISKTYRDRIISLQPDSLSNLQLQIQKIQIEVQDRGLQFRKESIYSQFASGQLMAEKRKNIPQMCPECGDELKKPFQCQLCAEVFCKKCCSRNRVIPFVSKELRLCCEQCHAKFVKLFHNKQFYEQKQKLVNVINFVRSKTLKIAEKISVKTKEVEDYKAEKRNERIKQKNIDNKIVQEQKKLKQLQDEFRRVVGEKAEKIKEEDRRKRVEEEERAKTKAAEEQRIRQQQKANRERQRLQEQEREQQRIKQRSILEQQLAQKLKKTSVNDMLLKKEEEIRKREEELQRREQQIKAFQQQKLKAQKQMKAYQEEKLRSEKEMKLYQDQKLKAAKNSKNSDNSSNSRLEEQTKNVETPKQSLDKDNSQKEKNIDTADSKSAARSRKVSEEIPTNSQDDLGNLYIKRQTSSNITSEHLDYNKEKSNNLIVKKQEQKQVDSLEKSLANMFKPKKQDDTKSIYSNMSRGSKSALDMSVNELLALRIPVNKVTPAKVQPIEEQKQSVSAPLLGSSQNYQQQILSPTKRPIDKVLSKIQQTKIQQQEIRIDRNSILRNSSLITSNKQTINDELTTGQNQKCSCQIM